MSFDIILNHVNSTLNPFFVIIGILNDTTPFFLYLLIGLFLQVASRP